MAVSTKWPPKLTNEAEYELWKKDIEIWCKLSELPKKKQALAIHLSLEGRARISTSELEVAALESDDGVKTILEKLDGLFLVDKGRRQFNVFQELYNLRRADGMEIRKFISQFEHAYYDFTKQNMSLPDSVRAFMLLASCKLSEGEQQLVMSAMSNVTYDNMTNALNRIFSGGFGGHASSPKHTAGIVDGIKTEPVFVGETGVDSEGNDTMFARDYQRGRSRVRGGRRGRQPYRARGTSRPSTEQNSSTWRRQNPLGTDGQVTRCIICDSRFHWARSCPDAYENKQGDNDTGDHKETACLSLFLGYTGTGGKDKGSKIQRLVEEAKGCAVLDSGCSTTVCGADWYGSFIQNLSDVERDSIFVEESTSSFTFGDGVTVSSVMRVTLPCMINGMSAKIVTDVVDCNIPLLLSRTSMKRAGMIVNFATDQVKIRDEIIKLGTSESGHYLLKISA